jgi:tRNA G46 methylase TrmB
MKSLACMADMTKSNTGRTPSRPVMSAQHEVHPRLESVVDSHLSRRWLQPLHQPSVRAFAALRDLIGEHPARLVLDSGCGNGESTRTIAGDMPDCLVVGIDRSAKRLARTGVQEFPYREDNAVWLRSDLPTFWRLALGHGWRLRAHYLLYPNPWPKARHLRRRWHGHPVFPDMLRLGGRLEMRSNWKIYAQEFALAASRVLGSGVRPEPLAESAVSSSFERKYRDSGHALYSVVCSADGNGV